MRVLRRAAPDPLPAWADGLHPVLARILATRGVGGAHELDFRLARLLPPDGLDGLDAAAALLDDAIRDGHRIVVVGDYDADGATATAVAVRGLRLLGARDVAYRVPNRVLHGYGLTPALVDELVALAPRLVVTVDNGIASHAGVARARALGMRVLVTDHHLPGTTLPDADAIVNPNLSGCGFPGKSLAGVGVMFYVLLALRALRRRAGAWAGGEEPDLATLLDLVALGTVADLVPLDANNRVLVASGLRRIRAGRCCAGVAALAAASNRNLEALTTGDLAFALAPRVNAAGRLEDMAIGIECLIADDAPRALALAHRLHAINAERREVQASMQDAAEAAVARWRARDDALPAALVLYEDGWHAGVVGLVASRVKEQANRPVIAFAPAGDGSDELRGSGRSIAGFHLRDALAAIDAREPGLVRRFGGHAMAAGLALARNELERFSAAFAAEAAARLDAAALEHCIWSDGGLAAADASLELAQLLREAAPWGQGFPEPQFDDDFAVESWRVVGERHLRLRLRFACGAPIEAVHFDAWRGTPPPARLHALYQLGIDDWRGERRVQLLLRQALPA
ncbi:MAG TPA: single-stranded-DNA-specific exonuclease RecJ [Xanthomonadales bacterium]|nr:single-stranded-DNA-specific exonuclease RecJ [Xanthomonadales bacterium]